MKHIELLVANVINGNLSDAKRQAKHHHVCDIREALQEHAGYSMHKAMLTADWLNGRPCWQEACDAD